MESIESAYILCEKSYEKEFITRNMVDFLGKQSPSIWNNRGAQWGGIWWKLYIS